MDSNILNMRMTNFQPESRAMAIFGKKVPMPKKWSNCIYITITLFFKSGQIAFILPKLHLYYHNF